MEEEENKKKEEKWMYKCGLCSRTFGSSQGLAGHMNGHRFHYNYRRGSTHLRFLSTGEPSGQDIRPPSPPPPSPSAINIGGGRRRLPLIVSSNINSTTVRLPQQHPSTANPNQLLNLQPRAVNPNQLLLQPATGLGVGSSSAINYINNNNAEAAAAVVAAVNQNNPIGAFLRGNSHASFDTQEEEVDTELKLGRG